MLSGFTAGPAKIEKFGCDFIAGPAKIRKSCRDFIAMKSEYFVLKEHAQYRWLSPNEVMTIEWAPVDIPTAKILENNY